MRRINKDDCRNAANELSKIAFDKKIEEIGEEFKVIGDKLVNAYIPKPLIALSKNIQICLSTRNVLLQFAQNKKDIGQIQSMFRLTS